MFMCVHLCLYVYTYIYLCIYECVCKCFSVMYLSVYVCACVHLHMCAYPCVCMYMCNCMSLCMCVFVCSYVSVCVCLYVYVCSCLCVCVCYKRKAELHFSTQSNGHKSTKSLLANKWVWKSRRQEGHLFRVSQTRQRQAGRVNTRSWYSSRSLQMWPAHLQTRTGGSAGQGLCVGGAMTALLFKSGERLCWDLEMSSMQAHVVITHRFWLGLQLELQFCISSQVLDDASAAFNRKLCLYQLQPETQQRPWRFVLVDLCQDATRLKMFSSIKCSATKASKTNVSPSKGWEWDFFLSRAGVVS